MFSKWIKSLLQKNCEHVFMLEDLRMINPDSTGADRVEWACDKCGKVFKAQCGLDITPTHGFIQQRRTQ